MKSYVQKFSTEKMIAHRPAERSATVAQESARSIPRDGTLSRRDFNAVISPVYLLEREHSEWWNRSRYCGHTHQQRPCGPNLGMLFVREERAADFL